MNEMPRIEEHMSREREVTGIVTTSFPRPKAMATLIAQAEIRSRISVLGITGGMLGDPLPGRSALDRKRAGLTEEQKPNRHKEDVAASSMFWRLKWKIERGEIPTK